MSMLSELSDPQVWEQFYRYKAGLWVSSPDVQELRQFIEEQGYLPVCRAIESGQPFPKPKKSLVNKGGQEKKRVVYSYPRRETWVLKLLTYRLLRRYDALFAPNLFSFRPGKTAKAAVRRLSEDARLQGMTAYKADISNYFNSIPIPLLLPRLRETLGEEELYAFLSSLLLEPAVRDRGKDVIEQKGIMAGTPLSAFYANLYLAPLDWYFARQGVPYARYSDDIIVFAPDEAGAGQWAEFIRDYLSSCGLCMNPDKEGFFSPEEGWTFLGFHCQGNRRDISPVTAKKLKAKMRRKARALRRWCEREDVSGEKAAKAFIRIFNRKLLEPPEGNELSWSHWFFSMITTADTLREIDHYAQDCLRFLITGSRRKSRFNARYEDLKALGYRSLVHEYYAFCKALRPPDAG